MTDTVIPAIMVGGSGTRLWPISRSNKPKQFLALGSELSMFQNTLTRVHADGFGRPWLLANDDALLHINAQLPATGVVPAGVIVEPIQRGTAAAIAAMVQLIGNKNSDALILVMPADHVISKPELFRDAVLRSVPLAKFGKIVTFGIVPTAPETGYGYIRPGNPLIVDNNSTGFSVEQPGGFLEKPNAVDAEKFVEQGYFWNAGIFLFKASTMLKEFQKYAARTFSAVSNAVSFRRQTIKINTTYHYLSVKDFERAPKDLPIDTAIMEKSSSVAVLPCGSIGWHDVGSLSAIWDMEEKCDNNNAVIGSGFAHESKGLLIYSGGGRKIVGSHLEDLMIVDTNDALIVIPRNKAQAVKQVVDALKAKQEAEVADTRALTMPWGEVQQISRNEKVLVALTTFNGGSCFGRSLINSASETWTVVSGEIEFTHNGHAFTLGEGKSLTFNYGASVVVQAKRPVASCVVVFQLGSQPLSLNELFADDVETNDAALRVA